MVGLNGVGLAEREELVESKDLDTSMSRCDRLERASLDVGRGTIVDEDLERGRLGDDGGDRAEESGVREHSKDGGLVDRVLELS